MEPTDSRSALYLHVTQDQPGKISRLYHQILRIVEHIKNKLGVYIDLINLYTPLGRITEMLRGPVYLSTWNPFKHISPGFLSGSVPLPEPNKLSDKPVSITRITTWTTKILSQACRLTNTNKKLARTMDSMHTAINNKDEEAVIKNASALANTLLHDIIAPIDITEQTEVGSHMMAVRDLMKYINDIYQCDKNIQAFANKLDDITINQVPKDKQEFLQLSIGKCIPMMRKSAIDNMSTEDMDAHKRGWMIARSKHMCQLHRFCLSLESPPSTETQHLDLEEKIDSIEESLPIPNIAYLPGKRELLILQAVCDIMNDAVIGDMMSPVVELLITELPNMNGFPDAHPNSDNLLSVLDETDMMAQYAALQTLPSNPEIMTNIINYLNPLIEETVSCIGERLISSLHQQAPSLDTQQINTIINDVITCSKIDSHTLTNIASKIGAETQMYSMYR